MAKRMASLGGFLLRKSDEFISVDDGMDYLCFTATSASTVKLATVDAGGTVPSVALEQSSDGITWTTFALDTVYSMNSGDIMYLRGDNNTFASVDSGNTGVSNYHKFVMTGSISASGNVMSLLDSSCLMDEMASPTNSAAFARLFQNCSAMTTAPYMPATVLAPFCYYGMFEGCSGLTDLPAVTAAYEATQAHAYQFKDCTNALRFQENIYPISFPSGVSGCFKGMLSGCVGISTPPLLSFTEIVSGNSDIYTALFHGCTGLTSLPGIVAVDGTPFGANLAEFFDGCSQIRFSIEQTGDYVYEFRIPDSGDVTTETVSDMFRGTGGTFTGNPSTNTIYYCNLPIIGIETPVDYLTFTAATASNIKFSATGSATAELQYRTGQSGVYGEWASYTLGSVISLSVDQSCQFKGDNQSFSTSDSSYIQFSSTGTVAASGNIMSLLDSTCKSTTLPCSYCFYALFQQCTGLTSTPELSATTLTDFCYRYMFQGCTGLTSAEDLPAPVATASCYRDMFKECTSLNPAPAIAAMTMASDCCDCMFYGCTSLIMPPRLPATTVAVRCYGGMFWNCSSLEAIPALPATVLVEGCYQYMFWYDRNIKLATSSSSTYVNAYVVPWGATSWSSTGSPFTYMFADTGGSWTGAPTGGVTYYTSNPIVLPTE